VAAVAGLVVRAGLAGGAAAAQTDPEVGARGGLRVLDAVGVQRVCGLNSRHASSPLRIIR